MIEPADRHRPDVTPETIRVIAEHRWGLDVHTVIEHPAEHARVFQLVTGRGQFAMRVAVESHDAWRPVHHQILDRLAQSALRSPTVVDATDGATTVHVGDLNYRLFSWVEGRRIVDLTRRPTQILHRIGTTASQVSTALTDLDSPSGSDEFLWDLRRAAQVIADLSEAVDDPGRRAMLLRIVDRAHLHVAAHEHDLPHGLVHGDLNDHNLLVDESGDIGVIDVTDAHCSYLVAELAIAAAYGALGAEDTVEAMARIAAGAHAERALTSSEMATIVPLAALRLALSVSISARRSAFGTADDYTSISEAAAWRALQQLDRQPFGVAELLVRSRCGVNPSPRGTAVAAWLAQHRNDMSPVLGVPHKPETVCAIDWSVTSTAADHPDIAEPMDRQCRSVATAMTDAGATVGIGRHGEPRIVYAAPEFATVGFDGPRWRTVHLGVDMSCPAGTSVHAVVDGVVHRIDDDAVDRGYGPVVTLRHTPDDGPTFFSLYGHLARHSVAHLTVGDVVRGGDPIATVGTPGENGGWVPHLHFQVMADDLGIDGPFPGVAAPDDWAAWAAVCPSPHDALGLPENVVHFPEPDVAATTREHRRRLPGNQSVSYDTPLVAVRGNGVWLYDPWGRGHLDTVNNVAHVGHQHPHVVAAVRRQTGLVDSNARYPHAERTRYLERLAATFPDHLDTVYLVSSGSEANELALRIARSVTRRRAVVTLEGGYHGNTGGLVDVSAYKHDGPGGHGPPPWVGVVPLPDPYRHPDRTDRASWRRRIGEVTAGLDEPPAAVIAEAISGVAGQVVLPPGFLPDLFDEVRRRGGLCIADEVQIGLGRVGSHWWGFEREGAVPDLVTLGKPIGNGYPLGAVVTTRAIAEAFDPGMEYFSTFGGNPVACAAGNAVLDVIEDEALVAHATAMEHRLVNDLTDLRDLHPLVGDVRGAGLFLGIELVGDPATREPAPDQARYVAERARRRGVLMSVDGLHRNVLKIKPPMVFADTHADQFVTTLTTILGEDGAQPGFTWDWMRNPD